MKCSNIQIDLLNGISSSEMAEHISKCSECRLFQDSMEKFLVAKPDVNSYVPPEEINSVVRDEARAYIEKQMKMYNVSVHRHSRIFLKLPSYLAAAACGVLIAWLVVLALTPYQNRRAGRELSARGVSNSFSSDLAGDDAISWGNVSMDEDFFTVSADIELNLMLISSSEQESYDNDME